jgi:hypothetical protein
MLLVPRWGASVEIAIDASSIINLLNAHALEVVASLDGHTMHFDPVKIPLVLDVIDVGFCVVRANFNRSLTFYLGPPH